MFFAVEEENLCSTSNSLNGITKFLKSNVTVELPHILNNQQTHIPRYFYRCNYFCSTCVNSGEYPKKLRRSVSRFVIDDVII